MIGIKIEGQEAISERLKRLPQAVTDKVNHELVQVGLEIVQKAQDKVPVRTHALQRSIRMENPRPLNIAVLAGGPGTGVNYAVYVEMGTSKMEAKPYLIPSVNETTKDLRERMEEAMTKATEEAGA